MNINNQVLQTADSLTLTASQTFQTSKAHMSDIIKRCIFFNASSINTKAGQACALLLILLFLISMVLVPFETAHATTATSSPVKWHPGHYYTLMGDKNNPTYLEKVYDELKSTPALHGVQIRYTWAELETSYDVYNFSSCIIFPPLTSVWLNLLHRINGLSFCYKQNHSTLKYFPSQTI